MECANHFLKGWKILAIVIWVIGPRFDVEHHIAFYEPYFG